MTILAEIFSQGEELVTGQTLDTNATWLAEQLNAIGFRVSRHTTVGDQLQDLVDVFTEISTRADCCICTGGLGPTCDDLTAEALSLASGRVLVFDEHALKAIEAYFSRRDRLMPESNRKQAYLPETAISIHNPVGTAPGFAFQFARCWFFCLPGVPAEMKAMFIETVLPQLPDKFDLQPERLISLYTVGIGESAIQERIKDLIIPREIKLGFRAALGSVQVKLLFSQSCQATTIQSWTLQVKQLLGDFVYAVEGLGEQSGDLLTVIDRQMQSRQHQLILIESISYGLLAQRCLAYKWLKDAKLVHPEKNFASMCQSISPKSLIPQAGEIILSQSCLHSLDEIHDSQQSIKLTICLQTDSAEYHKQVVLAGSIDYKQQQAAIYTLDFLRRYLFNLCL